MLPEPWVKKIFQKLSVVYGRDFLSRWEGQNLEDVLRDWGHELGGFSDQPDAIRFGLENLPADKPPTVLQFRAICNACPAPVLPRLPAPESRPAPEVVAQARQMRQAISEIPPKAWAWKLKAYEEAHPKSHGLTLAQREMWRRALASDLLALASAQAAEQPWVDRQAVTDQPVIQQPVEAS
jgi:hypothetical protein